MGRNRGEGAKTKVMQTQMRLGTQGERLLSTVATDIETVVYKETVPITRAVQGGIRIVLKVPGAIEQALQACGRRYQWHIIWLLLVALPFPVLVILLAVMRTFVPLPGVMGVADDRFRPIVDNLFMSILDPRLIEHGYTCN